MRTSIVSPAVLFLAACQMPARSGTEPARDPFSSRPVAASAAAAPALAVEVVPLRSHVAAELAHTLRNVAGAQDRENPARAPIIVSDPRTNSLILRGTREDIEWLKKLIAELDAKVTEQQ